MPMTQPYDKIPAEERCEHCQGWGIDPNTEPGDIVCLDCDVCGGSGKKEESKPCPK